MHATRPGKWHSDFVAYIALKTPPGNPSEVMLRAQNHSNHSSKTSTHAGVRKSDLRIIRQSMTSGPLSGCAMQSHEIGLVGRFRSSAAA